MAEEEARAAEEKAAAEAAEAEAAAAEEAAQAAEVCHHHPNRKPWLLGDCVPWSQSPVGSVLEQAAKLEAWAEPPAAGQAKRQKK